jgi:hypothetical protein
MNDDTVLTWDEAVEFVRQKTGGQIVLLKNDECIWLQWVGSEMTLQLQDNLVSDRGYLADSLSEWEKWPEEWANL